MILNNKPYPGWREGLTVREVLEENRFTWPKLVIKLNKRVVWPEEYDTTSVGAEDNLEVIHLLGGG